MPLTKPTPGGSNGTWGAELNATLDELDTRTDPATLSATYARGINLPAANGTDDTTAINAVLSANQGALIRGLRGQSYKISAPLVVKSGTTLDMSGCTITRIAGAPFNMLQNTQVVANNGRDSDITIVGGTWDAGNNSSGADDTKRHTIIFRRIDRVTVRDITANSTSGKYAVDFGDVTYFLAERITFATASDGVHINGPASMGTVRHLRGTTGDDTAAITAIDFAQYNDVQGPVTDVTFYDIDSTSSTNSVRLSGDQDRIHVEKIRQRGTVPVVSGSGTFTMGTLTIRDTVGGGIVLPSQATDAADTVIINNARRTGTANSQVLIQVGSKVKNLLMTNCSFDAGTFTGTHMVLLNATTSSIDKLVMRDCNHRGTSAYMVDIRGNGATITDATISGCQRDGMNSSGGVFLTETGAVLTRAKLSDLYTVNSSWLGDLIGTTVLHLSSVKCNGVVNIRATANVTLYASGLDCTSTSVAAGGVLRSKQLGYPIDVSLLARNNGDMAYNTNAALACGVGPVVCNGTSWKNLYSDAIYT